MGPPSGSVGHLAERIAMRQELWFEEPGFPFRRMRAEKPARAPSCAHAGQRPAASVGGAARWVTLSLMRLSLIRWSDADDAGVQAVTRFRDCLRSGGDRNGVCRIRAT